jgi:hypothetical protein
VIGLDDLDDQPDQRGRGEELAALLALGHRELAEKILVDLAERVALDVGWDRGHQLQDFDQRLGLEAGVGARQDALEVLVLLLDQAHRVVDRAAEVLALGQAQQMREARLLGHIDHALGLIVVLRDLATAPGDAAFKSLLRLREAGIGVAQEQQAEDRLAVLRSLELGVGPQLVRGIPQALLQIGDVRGQIGLPIQCDDPHITPCPDVDQP